MRKFAKSYIGKGGPHLALLVCQQVVLNVGANLHTLRSLDTEKYFHLSILKTFNNLLFLHLLKSESNFAVSNISRNQVHQILVYYKCKLPTNLSLDNSTLSFKLKMKSSI